MPTPSKPTDVLKFEKKSHRTKAELNQRKVAESELLSGVALKELQEVRDSEVAHKTFKRINVLLTNIGKNDAIYEQSVNRYCILVAECNDFETKKQMFYNDLEELSNDRQSFEDNDDIKTYYTLKNNIQKNIVNLDKQLQSKRKMLLDIEKENVMTIASSLRSIPKKVEKKSNALLEALGGG